MGNINITGKRKKLSTAITALTMATSLCTLLLMGIAMIITFYVLFYEKTREDMEYVLSGTSQQIQENIRFIKDGAVTIRHDAVIAEFFNSGSYSGNSAQTQLSYSMDLFSERNIVQQKQPFVRGVYLFNNANDCVSEQYYPITVSMEQAKKQKYARLQQSFKESGMQYDSDVDADNINLYFRLYDNQMQESGICIVEINTEAIQLILEPIVSYENSGWVILSDDNQVLASPKSGSMTSRLESFDEMYVGTMEIGNSQMLVDAQSSGFGIKIVIAASLSNIYILLRPTMCITLFVLLTAVIATAVVTYVISYRFTRPLKGTNESIRAFGKGHFDVRMGDSAIEEFHEVGVGFNEMADRIQYLITQVYEKQIIATQSQVKFLQSQINPHFQFNILAMLSLKAKMAGNEELYVSLQAFSKLMQGKIFRQKEIKIPVKKEIELVNYYLLLQNNRYEDKITYQINYGDESVGDMLIPRLLIEPLVENAVSHGLEPKGGNGNIRIDVYAYDEHLHITVEDDGVGIDPNELGIEHTRDTGWKEEIGHTHTGLENTERLLRILYADRYKMEIHGEKGKGTTVRMILPMEREEKGGKKYVEGDGGR